MTAEFDVAGLSSAGVAFLPSVEKFFVCIEKIKVLWYNNFDKVVWL